MECPYLCYLFEHKLSKIVSPRLRKRQIKEKLSCKVELEKKDIEQSLFKRDTEKRLQEYEKIFNDIGREYIEKHFHEALKKLTMRMERKGLESIHY